MKRKLSVRRALRLLQGNVPRQLVIQLTDACNARCPQCGMRVTEKYSRSWIEPDVVKRIIRTAAVTGVEILSFTGGEPFLHFEQLMEYIHYAAEQGIGYIRTGTNGFLFKDTEDADFYPRIRKIAAALARSPLRNLWISLDSAEPAVHETMRGLPGVVAGIKKALPVFHDYGIYPAANLGINRNIGGELTNPRMRQQGARLPAAEASFSRRFRQGFRQFFERVIDLGFTICGLCYPMNGRTANTTKLDAVYGAISTDRVIDFSPREKASLYAVLLEVIPEYRHRIRLIPPLSSVYALARQARGESDFPFPCSGGIDSFFVNAAGQNTYPCGYRGDEELGKFWERKWQESGKTEPCLRCDWECFRDPAELLGPFKHFREDAFRVIGKFFTNNTYRRYWLEDLRYYSACHFFNGRETLRPESLSRFDPAKKPRNLKTRSCSQPLS